MNIKITFFLLLGLINLVSVAQDKFPKGVYMSLQEFISKKPSQNYNLVVEKRTMGDIKMNGGNDFKLLSINNEIDKKFIKTKIWGYSDGNTFYLNCFQYKTQNWYAELISDGKYMVFYGGLSQKVDLQKKQIKSIPTIGPIGGGIQGAKLATLRFLYVIDKENNNLYHITTETIKEVLKLDSELLNLYEKEVEKNDDILVKYLQLFNEKSE